MSIGAAIQVVRQMMGHNRDLNTRVVDPRELLILQLISTIRNGIERQEEERQNYLAHKEGWENRMAQLVGTTQDEALKEVAQAFLQWSEAVLSIGDQKIAANQELLTKLERYSKNH